MAGETGWLRSLMFKAMDIGASFNSFYRSATSHDIHIRRASLLEVWQDVKSEYVQRQALRGLSAGDIPEHVEITKSKYQYTEPYVYKARVEAQLSAGAPVTERWVTVLSPEALSLGGITGQVLAKWPTWEYGRRERILKVEVTAAIYVPQ